MVVEICEVVVGFPVVVDVFVVVVDEPDVVVVSVVDVVVEYAVDVIDVVDV